MSRRLFGQYLVDEGYVRPEQLAEGLRQQMRLQRIPIGEVIVELGLLRSDELTRQLARHLGSLAIEGGERRRFGEHLVEEGLITSADLERALWHQQRLRRIRIGETLVRLGCLEPHRLSQAVQDQLREMADA